MKDSFAVMKYCKSILKGFPLCSFVRVENETEKASPKVLRHKSMVSKDDSGDHCPFSLRAWL